jgi:arylsulfatase A-like enzyme
MPRLVVPVARDGGPSNVIVYLIDTLRADHTSPYGYARPTTPRLDALARQGVVFDNAFSVASWTRPAVASLLTGLYPAAHGADTDSGLPDAVATLAERFRAAGWSTAAFVASGHVFGAKLNFEQGFDRFLAVRGEGLESARTEEINVQLLPHLARYGDEPFLIYVHAVDPHAPYDPPEAYRGRFADASYDGAITPADTLQDRLRARSLGARDVQHVVDLYDEDVRYQDDMLGVLLDNLSRMDLERRTIVIVVADHGEELFDHGSWGHGQRLWQEVVRIPLVIHVPGASALSGRRIAAPVQIVDVMPTLLGWFGVPGREACQGQDLRSLLDGRGTLERPVYFEERRPRPGFDLVGLVDGTWKIVRRRPRSDVGPPVARIAPDQLFDLASDPRERSDVAPRAPERLAAMQDLLARAESEHGPRPDAAPDSVAARLDEPTHRQLEALGYVLPDGGDGAPRDPSR